MKTGSHGWLVAALFVVGAVCAEAGTYTWIGPANSDWLTTANWSPSGFANTLVDVCDVNAGGMPRATAATTFFGQLNVTTGAVLSTGFTISPTVSNLHLRGGTFLSGDNGGLSGNVVVESTSVVVSCSSESTGIGAVFSGSGDLIVSNRTSGASGRCMGFTGRSVDYGGKWRLFSTSAGAINLGDVFGNGSVGTGGMVLSAGGSNVHVNVVTTCPWDLDLSGARIWVNAPYVSPTHTGVITLRSDATLIADADSFYTRYATLNGRITGSGKLRSWVANTASRLILNCPTNDYSGGTDIVTNTLRAATNSCMGTGPVNIYAGGTLEVMVSGAMTNMVTLFLDFNGSAYGKINMAGAGITTTVARAFTGSTGGWDSRFDYALLASGTYTSNNLPNYIIGSGTLVVAALRGTTIMIR